MKNKKPKISNRISLLCNFLVTLFTVFSVIVFYFGSLDGNMTGDGPDIFMYFTVDSNILCAISCIVMLYFNIKKKGVPKAAIKFKGIGTAAVTVTLVTVIIFLGPIFGYDKMVEGCNIFLHVLNPLLAIISFMLFEGRLQRKNIWLSKANRTPISSKESMLGVIPVAIYASVYIYMVLYTKWWDDFYCFNSGFMEGKWYLSLVGMAILTVVICLIERGVHAALSECE